MDWLNTTEFAIEMDQRSLVRLKPGSFHSAKKYRVSSDHGFLDDFAIKHGECVDESGDTARHIDPFFFVEPVFAFDLRKQLRKVKFIMRLVPESTFTERIREAGPPSTTKLQSWLDHTTHR